ncbi:MAG: hypothetical protein IAE95_14475 [Chitinophagaceae bacterium]|nr:hypothetical protein [Chitinophagaceae bacterium]
MKRNLALIIFFVLYSCNSPAHKSGNYESVNLEVIPFILSDSEAAKLIGWSVELRQQNYLVIRHMNNHDAFGKTYLVVNNDTDVVKYRIYPSEVTYSSERKYVNAHDSSHVSDMIKKVKLYYSLHIDAFFWEPKKGLLYFKKGDQRLIFQPYDSKPLDSLRIFSKRLPIKPKWYILH